ncbi:MAG: CarD family transcriptional regulator, partial [Firmicutes bacterium]|nr:CarD family transcriptional regulator [Bacillota bacterium]
NDRSTFFVPADNEKSKVKVRDLLSVEEVDSLISAMPSQEEIEIINENQRKDIYKSIVEIFLI